MDSTTATRVTATSSTVTWQDSAFMSETQSRFFLVRQLQGLQVNFSRWKASNPKGEGAFLWSLQMWGEIIAAGNVEGASICSQMNESGLFVE
jgi:hypothetical protein